MKFKLAAAILAAGSLALSPLAASETVREVVATTELRPSAPVLPRPLAGPPPIGLALESDDPPPWLGPVPPLRLPDYRPPYRTGKALFDANLALMVALNVADYFSTREALKYPGHTESNPLMRPFVKSPAAFAAAKLGTTALSYWSMKTLFKKNRTFAWVMTTAGNVLLTYAVASNIRLIRSARAR